MRRCWCVCLRVGGGQGRGNASRHVLTALDKIMCLAAAFNLSATRKTNKQQGQRLQFSESLSLFLHLSPSFSLHTCVCGSASMWQSRPQQHASTFSAGLPGAHTRALIQCVCFVLAYKSLAPVALQIVSLQHPMRKDSHACTARAHTHTHVLLMCVKNKHKNQTTRGIDYPLSCQSISLPSFHCFRR